VRREGAVVGVCGFEPQTRNSPCLQRIGREQNKEGGGDTASQCFGDGEKRAIMTPWRSTRAQSLQRHDNCSVGAGDVVKVRQSKGGRRTRRQQKGRLGKIWAALAVMLAEAQMTCLSRPAGLRASHANPAQPWALRALRALPTLTLDSNWPCHLSQPHPCPTPYNFLTGHGEGHKQLFSSFVTL
jgi:hypothetical protein